MEENRPRLNISHVFQLQTNSQIKQLYTTIDLDRDQPDDGGPQDLSGYIGKFYREKS